MANMTDEFTAPARGFDDRAEIAPAQIMAMFPHVDVTRSTQGNGYTVSVWNDVSKRWSVWKTARNTTEALAHAAVFHA